MISTWTELCLETLKNCTTLSAFFVDLQHSLSIWLISKKFLCRIRSIHYWLYHCRVQPSSEKWYLRCQLWCHRTIRSLSTLQYNQWVWHDEKLSSGYAFVISWKWHLVRGYTDATIITKFTTILHPRDGEKGLRTISPLPKFPSWKW